MKAKVPKKSRLRFPYDEYGYGTCLENHPRQIMVIALVALYAPTEFDRIQLYRRYKNKVTEFLRACVNGEIEPCLNQLQASLNELCPKSSSMHVYIPARRSDRPSHYVSLVRDDESRLWSLKTPRIYEVKSYKRLSRDGVLIHLKSKYTPLPDIACNLDILVKRVLVGGRGIHEMVAEILESYELQRQLTHCAMTCELFSCLNANRVVVRDTPGKAVFLVTEPTSHDIMPMAPWEFESERISPYARKVTKPSVIVWGSASPDSLYVAQKPRSIQPQIRNAMTYESNDKEFEFIKAILQSRLLPFLGVVREDGSLDILGLSYDPLKQVTDIVAYSRGRRASSFAMIPQFRWHPQRNVWIPNCRAVEVQKALLLDDSDDKAAVEQRRKWLAHVLDGQGIPNSNSYPMAFEFWGQPLSNEEEARLVKLWKL